MDLIDKIDELASRIGRQKTITMTEEASKTAFVLPFLQALGYDVFNPKEVVPEFTADHGVKKGEKVDYALNHDGHTRILIECKPVGTDLSSKYTDQLYRYFSVTDAKFGILTDGIKYLFFSDLEKPNRMDNIPFFEFDFLDYGDRQIEELKQFVKDKFDIDAIVTSANKLKYRRALIREIAKEFDSPSEGLVRLLTSRVYSGRFTQNIREEFGSFVKLALHDYLRGAVKARLKSALDSERDEGTKDQANESETPLVEDDGIETTESELFAYRIILAIGSEVTDTSRIAIRDAKSYCAILFDNNNRKPICRLLFGKRRLAVSIFCRNGEKKVDIQGVKDIYKHKEDILDAIRQYL